MPSSKATRAPDSPVQVHICHKIRYSPEHCRAEKSVTGFSVKVTIVDLLKSLELLKNLENIEKSMTVKIKITHKMSLHGENRSYHFAEFPYNLTLTLCVRNAFLGSEIAL